MLQQPPFVSIRVHSWSVYRRSRGLSLVEILLCVAIAAMMLLATGIAFRASVMSYRDNTERNLLTSTGRNVLNKIIAEIRQADAHGPVNDSTLPNATTLFASGQITENAGIQLLKKQPDTDDPNIVPGNSNTYVLITYSYDPATFRILRTRSAAGVTTTDTVADYVQDFKVRMEPVRSAANVAAGNTSFDLLLRAVVFISLDNTDANGKMLNTQGNGLITTRLIDAAVPRKNFAGL